MTILCEVIQTIFAIGEIYLCYCFVDLFEKNDWEKKNRIYIVCWSIGIGALLAWNRHGNWGMISWGMLIIQSMLISLSIANKVSCNRRLTFYLVAACDIYICFIQLLFAFLLITIIPGADSENVYVQMSFYRVMCYVGALIVSGIVFGVLLRSKDIFQMKNKALREILFLFDVAGVCLISVFQGQIVDYGIRNSMKNSFSLCLIIGASLLLLICVAKGTKIKGEMQMLAWKNELLEENYQEIKDMYQNYSYTYHDMKNHLTIVQSYCKEGKTEKAIDYIDKIQNTMIPVRRYIKSNNEIIDIIINYKCTEAEKDGIYVEVYADEFENIEIEENDLCVILSNLLDNAIEACRAIETENKWIRILVKVVGETVWINVSNSCEKSSERWNTKKKGFHGYGLKSVQTSVDKYEGKMKLDYKDNVCTVTISFGDICLKGVQE